MPDTSTSIRAANPSRRRSRPRPSAGIQFTCSVRTVPPVTADQCRASHVTVAAGATSPTHAPRRPSRAPTATRTTPSTAWTTSSALNGSAWGRWSWGRGAGSRSPGRHGDRGWVSSVVGPRHCRSAYSPPAPDRAGGHPLDPPWARRPRRRGRGCLHRVGWPTTLVQMGLTERDKAILDFERSWWANPGRKDESVRERLELSMTRYYELLTEILGDPESLQFDPLLVRRLKRDRDRRRRERFEPRPATEWRSP